MDIVAICSDFRAQGKRNAKRLSEEALQKAEKRRDVKSKGEKER